MSKPYTEDELAAQLSQDLTWRLKEISDLKAAVIGSDPVARPALLRALLAIAYAHWEGHVRFAAKKYLTHVALRKLTFDQLKSQFLRNNFLPRLGAVGTKNIRERGSLVDEILGSGGRRFATVNKDLIDTRANLNSDVLADICLVCDMDTSVFKGRETFIDVFLLKRRNAIAHGEDTFINVGDLDELSDGTVNLMRLFSNELQAQAYLGKFRAAS